MKKWKSRVDCEIISAVGLKLAMKSEDKQSIIDRYNQRVQKFGATIDALASGTEDRRQLRFKVLTQIGIASGDSVLDLGCGFGDYWLHCQKEGLAVQYAGIDINPMLIEKAKARFPGVSFEVKDIQTDVVGPVDYIVSTSCFNLRLRGEDNYAFIEDLLRRCYPLARKGVAMDFLSSYVDYRGGDDVFHYEPEKVFAIAKKITKRVCLRHDYPLFEFCIYLYPDFQGWASNARP